MKLKKGNKRSNSDAIYAKKSKVNEKKQNPFELHVNREKFNILNRKRNHSLGQPLVSRQKAFDKRKETLGAEYSVRNKTNVFEDRRRDGYRKLPKESIYNLNDSEVLTHRGQTLGEIEQFDDAVAEEDNDRSDEEELARLDANFTKMAHFGGGGGGADDYGKDRKTAIEELIADSKKRKAERMKEHEEMLDLTNKLDTDWKDLIAVMKKMERTETSDKPEPDAYDRLVKEMIFSPRGGEPAQKLRSEEELARIERDKLESLENMRVQRMRDDSDDPMTVAKRMNHRSADDLDDGYLLEPILDEEEDQVLSYPLKPESRQATHDDADEDDDMTKQPAAKGNDDAGDSDAEENHDEAASDEEENEYDVDSLDDLKADSSEDNASETEEHAKEAVASESKPNSINPLDSSIPFTIQMPASYENLLELLSNQSIRAQSTIIERIIKTNHPKLYFLNESKMQKLFAYLLQYINDLFSNFDESNVGKYFRLVRHLTPHLFDLVQMSPAVCSESFLEVVKEKYEDYRRHPRIFPKLDTLIFFQVMPSLFPTSDFRHPVVTPAYVFLHHILSQAKVKSRASVSAGLFLVTLTLDFQRISKRFLPSVMNFLTGICYLGLKKSRVANSAKVIPSPPFRRMDELLVLSARYESEFSSSSEPLRSCDFIDTPIDDNFKARSLYLASSLMRDLMQIYDEHVGMKYLLDPFENVLKCLRDEEELPLALKANINGILEDFKRTQLDKKFKYPEPEKKNLPMLRLLEPRFESVHTDRRQMYCQSGNTEKRKLKHMVKRETKAAKRELRRDNEFLAQIKHKRQRQMDVERKEKVKRIFQEANLQQSEFKALSRTKGRKGAF